MARQVVTVVLVIDNDETDDVCCVEDILQHAIDTSNENITGFDIIDIRDADEDE